MIHEGNVDKFQLQLGGISIFPVDIQHIVYGEDTKKEMTNTCPEDGDTPFLKYPEEDVWLRIVQKSSDI